MTSYAISIWTCCVTADLNVAVFTSPRRLPEWMMHYPAFPYVRVMYLILDPCTWESCYGDYNLMPPEVSEMQWHLFRNSIVYFVLALYLNEVVPQTYGVAKHPLWLCEGLVKKYLPPLYSLVFADTDHLKVVRRESELEQEDIDTKNER